MSTNSTATTTPQAATLDSQLFTPDLLSAINTLLIQSQNPPPNTPPPSLLHLSQLLQILHTRTQTSFPSAFTQLFTYFLHYHPSPLLIHSLFSRVHDHLITNPTSTSITAFLSALVTEAKSSSDDLVDQICTLLQPNDTILLLHHSSSILSSALLQFADTLPSTSHLTILLLVIHPDPTSVSSTLHSTLSSHPRLNVTLLPDRFSTLALRKCDKLLIHGTTLHAEEGMVCHRGSRVIIGLANRMRIPVVGVIERCRMVGVNGVLVRKLSLERGDVGKVWDYAASRGAKHPVDVVSGVWDVIGIHKFETIVTEQGGFAAEYVSSLVPMREAGVEVHESEGATSSG